MEAISNQSATASTPAKAANGKPPDIAAMSVPDTLAALQVNPDTGLTHAQVDASRKELGYNEVAQTKGHPVLKFLGKCRSAGEGTSGPRPISGARRNCCDDPRLR